MKRDPIRPPGQTAVGRAGAALPVQGRAPSGDSSPSTGPSTSPGTSPGTGSGVALGMTANTSAPVPSRPGVNLASESVAGEEDPGASLDMGINAPGSVKVPVGVGGA